MAHDPAPTLLRLRDARHALIEGGVIGALDEALAEMLPRAPAAVDDKIVKDLVWGVISIPGFLVPLVDSRLYQRQRRIRQLGMSYLVYPGCGYSRFEHGLGCCHVMSTILRTVGDRSDLVPARVRTQLLAGALLHDVGHLPFSHASERGLEQWHDSLSIGALTVRQILRVLNDALATPDLKLAEAISVLVVLSNSFAACMRALVGADVDADYCLELAAYLAGAHLGREQMAYSQVLSGAVDADRLDYVVRDSKVCGIPVSVDVGRLLQRCRFVKVPATRLPDVMRDLHGRDGDALVFVTDLSGANALEEMAMSRFVLYDRVYNHHKTQAAEAVLRELLTTSVAEGMIGPQLLPFWRQNDEEFLYRTMGNARTRPLAERLLYRDLPKRAVVYGLSLMARPVVPFDAVDVPEQGATEDDRAGTVTAQGLHAILDRVDELIRVAEPRRQFTERIVARAQRLAAYLEPRERPPGERPAVFMSHRPGSPLRTFNSAHVMDPGPDSRIRQLDDHMPLEEWSEAFHFNKAFGYVFCDPGWEQLVHIATEMVLWEEHAATAGPFRFAFRLTPPARTRAKLSARPLLHIKQKLDEREAFKSCRGLRSVVTTHARIDQIADSFRQFQGVSGWSVTSKSVRGFLRQFPMALQDDVADVLLTRMELLKRKTLTRAIAARILESPYRPDSACVPLSKNSGVLIRSWVETEYARRLPTTDFSRPTIAQVTPEHAAVFLIDDVLSSGSQASCQLQAWCGVPRASWRDPSERGIDESPLSDVALRRLQERPVRLVVARGTQDGIRSVEGLARELGFSDFAVIAHETLAMDDVTAVVPAALESCLRDVGRQVLKVRGPIADDRADADALGYGGRTAMLISTLNVPTCCPPAFWCPGIVDGTPWTPLFIRRGYEDRVVLA